MSEKLSMYSNCECLQVKKIAMNAIESSKKLLNFVKSLMGENNFSAPPNPPYVIGHIFFDRLRFLGPLG